MKLVIAALIATFTSPAMALEINPANGKVCLQRTYTAEHMAANPKQKLSEVTILLERVTDEYDGEKYTWDVAKLVGKNPKDGALYGNTAGCTFDENGEAFCSIDCDGGSFSLKKRPSVANTQWINFVVTESYYFPFYKGVMEPSMEVETPEVALDGDDKANSTWRVENVPVERCEEKLSQLGNQDGGC